MKRVRLLRWSIAPCLLGLAAAPVAASQPERLTHDGRLKLAPTFTDNGREIVFATHELPNLVTLKRLRLADGSQERLHPGMTAHQFDPAFSPDGRYYAYARSASSPQLQLVIRDSRQSAESVFSTIGARDAVRSPVFTRDGQRVVFSLSADGGQQLVSVNLQGRDLQPLTQSPGVNSSPAMSPDGRWIAFSSSRSGDFDIYLMSVDGREVRRLTTSRGMDLRPAWSPDGKHIAFTTSRDGNYEIYLMNADGTDQRNLTEYPERDDFPIWHPDGRRLLAVLERAGMYDLYLFDVPR